MIHKALIAALLISVLTLTAGCGLIPEFTPGTAQNTAKLDRVLDANPDNVHAHYLRALSLLDQNDPASAAAHFQKATKLKPDFEEAWEGLGIARMDQQKYKAAKKTFDAMALQFPDSATAREGQAAASIGMGDTDAARLYAREALEINPDSAQAYRHLGEVAYVDGEYQKALDFWVKAMDLDPNLSSQIGPTARDLYEFLQKYGE